MNQGRIWCVVNPTVGLPLFLAGAVAYLFRDRIKYTMTGCVVSVCVLVVACFIPNAFGPVFPLAGGYLLFWISFHPTIRFFNASRFGDLSYGAYLFAFPIQQLIVSVSGHRMEPLALFAVSTPIILLAALTSYHLIEHPFMQLGKDAASVFPLPSAFRTLSQRLQISSRFLIPEAVETNHGRVMSTLNTRTAEISRSQLSDQASFYLKADEVKAEVTV